MSAHSLSLKYLIAVSPLDSSSNFSDKVFLSLQDEIGDLFLCFRDLSFSPTEGRLTCRDRSLLLSAKEKEIMSLLFLNPHSPVSKETLLTKVWGYDSDAVDNNVEAYISFLRKKLLLLGSRVQITARRRIGYSLEVSEL